ncbi:hypothetical protein ABIE89_000537 [Bradyrhizobium niftali]|uniref:hypothetical protein n=1 Tax=Bradyrhizobium niftali TaxID=2560055 RepID=UPI00383917A3
MVDGLEDDAPIIRHRLEMISPFLGQVLHRLFGQNVVLSRIFLMRDQIALRLCHRRGFLVRCDGDAFRVIVCESATKPNCLHSVTKIYVSGQNQTQVRAGNAFVPSADFEKIEGLSPLLSCIGSCSLLALRFCR